MSARLSSRPNFILIAAIVAAALAFTWLAPVGASHQPGHLPADKVAVASSNIEFLGTSITGEPPAATQEAEVLHTRIRASNRVDLLISLTSECALWTDVTTIGTDDSEAFAQVRMWVEINGEPVPVSEPVNGETDDDGKVVFCNRTYQRVTEFHGDDEDHQIETYFATRSANAFNWIALDLPNGIHDITVMAEVVARVQPIARAQGAIGYRSLIIEPVRLPVGTGLPPQEPIEVDTD
jgi:hypothetical protein